LIKILVVDDHTLVRTGVKRILDDISGFKVVGEAQTGEEAIQLARELSPNVVLMDIKMPGIGGLEATRKLLRFDPDIKILVLTVCSDDLFPSRLLQAGAVGYITKDASTEEMIRAIRIINSGQRYLSPEIASQLAIKHLTESSETPFEMLSERELQVAIMITNGVRVQAISEKLCLSPKTVNSYRYRIFDKLNIKNDVELTHLAMRHGLLSEMAELPAE